MSIERFKQIMEEMDPKKAASVIGNLLKEIFPLLDEDARLEFVLNLIGDSDDDKVTSLVHL